MIHKKRQQPIYDFSIVINSITKLPSAHAPSLLNYSDVFLTAGLSKNMPQGSPVKFSVPVKILVQLEDTSAVTINQSLPMPSASHSFFVPTSRGTSQGGPLGERMETSSRTVSPGQDLHRCCSHCILAMREPTRESWFPWDALGIINVGRSSRDLRVRTDGWPLPSRCHGRLSTEPWPVGF